MPVYTVTPSAIAEFREARELAVKFATPTSSEYLMAGQLAWHLQKVLDALDALRTTVAEQEAEIIGGRDSVHRARMLCARGPVVFTKDVRAALDGRS